MYGRKEELFKERNVMIDSYIWYPDVTFDLPIIFTLQDIYELINLGIIDSDNLMLSKSLDSTPGKFKLSLIGEKYYQLMGLESVPTEDVEEVLKNIEYKEYFGVSNQGRKNGILPTNP